MEADSLTLLDAYALLALLRGERAAEEVGGLIREGGAAVPAVNLAESVDVLTRRYEIDRQRVRSAIGSLTERALAVVPVDRSSAMRAAELRAAHYHRTRRPLSLADCILLASAGAGDRIATADRHVLAVAGSEKVEAIALPGARG